MSGGMSPSDKSIVGKPIRRIDGVAKVTGRATFAGDVMLPDMLWGRGSATTTTWRGVL